MRQRIVILLKIDNVFYKFLSIFQNKSDASFYIYQHIKDEKSPVKIAESFHLLKTAGNFNTDVLEKRLEKNGDRIHLLIHPNRIYLKRVNADGSKEHLIEEYEPQPFNKADFRLRALFTPPPVSRMEKYNVQKNKKGVEEVAFSWKKLTCPQISVYELGEKFSLKQINNLLPPGDEIITIPTDGIHPAIGLHLKSTNGGLGVWRPNCGIFGKIVKKKPISKQELQKIIKYNELNFDVSSLPDNAIITDYKIEYPEKQDQ